MTGRKHPSEETLDRYVSNPEVVADLEAIEAHLQDCTRCGEYVADARAFDAALSAPETWQLSIQPKRTPDQVARALETLREEAAAASALLDPLIISPAAFARAAIESDPRYRTAGVVRKLCDSSAEAREDQPRHALKLADAALAIVDALRVEQSYEPDVLANLRGNVGRERANALRYLSRHDDALAALDDAEEAFRETLVPEFDLARVTFIRATIFWKMERFEEALAAARQARAVFTAWGDLRRQVDTGLLEGGVLFDSGQYDKALAMFFSLDPLLAMLDDASARARLSNNIAAAYIELDQPAFAAPYLHEAAALFEHLGFAIERLRTEWSIALLSVRQGQRQPGIMRLRAVASRFEARGSLSDAALVALDIVEQHLLAGEFADAEAYCRKIVETFANAGMMKSAVMALQYLRDAVGGGRATSRDVQEVKKYLKRLVHEPELLFLPPPPAT
jgi:tetratricopeptide (TPR) repeat protein